MLESVTPVVLTLDEAANIGRVLERLSWAREVLVLDSGSTDETVAIARSFANVRLLVRPFDNAARQWSFAAFESGVKSEWVLALDADYVLADGFADELRALAPPAEVAGYSARFVYCVGGRPLRGTLYPPVTVLYRRTKARYVQDGHTQRVAVEGAVRPLRTPIRHDDRKPLSNWLRNQARYMLLEAELLHSRSFRELSLADRARKLHLGPPAVLLYCLVVQRGLLDGWAGLHYALQRTVAEALISLGLLERIVRGGKPGAPPAA
jgi:glycosyltransferase involved in cell wall biosynthesis